MLLVEMYIVQVYVNMKHKIQCNENIIFVIIHIRFYRLLDFTSLNAKKKPSEVYYEPKKKKEPIKSKKEEKLTEMMANSAHNLNETADSNSEVSCNQFLCL